MIGKTLAQYEILSMLGEGGMGVVYLARDPRLERNVALKVLSEELSRDENYRQRFLDEARAASALNHPNVVTIYEIGSDGGRDFIAMEYVEGRDLQALISERGALPLDDLLEIGKQLAAGVAAAHRAGILHRDLKPGNVILTGDGAVKILDFGLAKRRAPPGPAPGRNMGASAGGFDPTVVVRTVPGTIMGTPGYMSPEKARGQEEDQRSDIFSVGCILYALASGRTPFQGDSFIDVLHNVLHTPPVGVETQRTDLPVEFREILGHCLEKDPRQRMADAAEIESGLKRIQLTQQNRTWTPAAGTPAVERSGRRVVPLAVVGAVALAIVAAVLYLATRPDSAVATKTVTVQDEEGQQIQREIPVHEFRKRLAIFPFHPDTSDTNRTWLAYAASGLLTMDIIQDYYVSLDLTAELEFAQEAGKVGYPGGLGAPLTLMRQTARASSSSHFVTGRVGVDESAAWMEARLYETESSRLESEFRREGETLFAVTDEVSVELRRLLGVPEEHRCTWPDLPVTEVSTDSPAALEELYRAQQATLTDFDLPAARRHLENAVAADPAFAWALLSLYNSYLQDADGVNARIDEVIEACMTHIYRLPERMQFAAKCAYFEYKSQPKKQLAVLRMWRELYPDDTLACELLVQILHVQGLHEEKLDVMGQLLEIEPRNTRYLTQIAGMYQDLGDLETARRHLEALAEIAPEDPNSHRALGELLQVKGDHAAARDAFEQALLLNPKDLQLQADLAEAEFQLGNSTTADAILESIQEQNLSPVERLQANQALSQHLARIGQIDRALSVMAAGVEESAGKIAPIQHLSSRAWLARLHVKNGDAAEGRRIADEIRGQFAYPLSAVGSIFALRIYIELGDFAVSHELSDEMGRVIEQMGWEHVRPIRQRLLGILLEKEDKPGEALAHYENFLALDPTDARAHHYLGRCLRKIGKYERARDELASALARQPYHPESLVEAALVDHELGARAQARERLERALQVWSGADVDYEPARAAGELLADWSRAK